MAECPPSRSTFTQHAFSNHCRITVDVCFVWILIYPTPFEVSTQSRHQPSHDSIVVRIMSGSLQEVASDAVGSQCPRLSSTLQPFGARGKAKAKGFGAALTTEKQAQQKRDCAKRDRLLARAPAHVKAKWDAIKSLSGRDRLNNEQQARFHEYFVLRRHIHGHVLATDCRRHILTESEQFPTIAFPSEPAPLPMPWRHCTRSRDVPGPPQGRCWRVRGASLA